MRVEIFEDTSDDWRWRLCQLDGRVLACSTEGRSSRTEVVRGLIPIAKRAQGGKMRNAFVQCIIDASHDASKKTIWPVPCIAGPFRESGGNVVYIDRIAQESNVQASLVRADAAIVAGTGEHML